MIEILKEKIKTGNSYNDKLNLIREFLQILILKIMFDKNHFNYLSFHGGTALRILFKVRRFSEDLDVSLINTKNYVYTNLVSEI
jgi:predicted nucleotidyltransferase component of viral defense system